MIQPVLFDSSVYVSALRRGTRPDLRYPLEPVWLSSVVLEELYAGASDRDRPNVEQLEAEFEENHRILVPSLRDWTQTGRVLARLAVKYGYEHIGKGRLTNDALISLSAGRLGVTVITHNERDFKRLAEFVSFQWDLSAL